MITPAYLVQMAAYNLDMNEKLYAAAAQLPHEALAAERGAFFGSILGTLNHLMVGDTIWLKRFAAHPAAPPALQAMQAVALPPSLTHSFGDELAALRAVRRQRDGVISAWAAQMTAAALAQPLSYHSTKGQPFRKDFGAVITHFFNHQTHHRGQISTLLSQAGIDIGVTDLVAMVADV